MEINQNPADGKSEAINETRPLGTTQYFDKQFS
jgi:hypothetical protein